MEAKINNLNQLYSAGKLTLLVYMTEAKTLLDGMDWQRRMQYENMLYVSVY